MAGYIGARASVVSSGAERKQTYAITTTTTSLTGLAYTPTKVHVYHNGIRLVDGTDYTATDGETITLTTAAEDGDEVVVISYATFQTSDTVSAANGGTFAGNVTFNTDARFNEYIGVNGDPLQALHIHGDGSGNSRRIFIEDASAGGNAGLRFKLTSANGTDRYGGYYFEPEDAAGESFVGLTADDANTHLKVDASGHVLKPYQPAFRVNATLAQSLGAGWATVGYNTSLQQRGSGYNSSTSIYTAPIAGWYHFTAGFTADSNSDIDGTLSLSINNSTSDLVNSVSQPQTGPNFEGHIVAGSTYLAKNDNVRVLRYSSVATTTRTSQTYGGWFSGFLIG